MAWLTGYPRADIKWHPTITWINVLNVECV